MNIGDSSFRHGNYEAQNIVLRKLAQRQVTLVRRSSRRKQRAGVGIDLRNDAVEGRGDARISEQSLIFAECGFRGEHFLLGGRHRVARGGHARVGFEILALCGVNFLLCHQLGPSFLHAYQTCVGEVRDVVGGFRAIEFLAGARQVLIAAPSACFVLLQLLLQFGNFQLGEELALLYMRSPIYSRAF